MLNRTPLRHVTERVGTLHDDEPQLASRVLRVLLRQRAFATRTWTLSLLSLVLALTGALAWPTAAHAVDTVAPGIVSVSAGSSQPLAAGESFPIRMQTTEPVHVLMSYRSPSGKSRTPQGSIVPGTSETFSFSVGDDYENGTWDLEYVSITDGAGNMATYYANGTIRKDPTGLTGPTSHTLDFSTDSFTVENPPSEAPSEVTAVAGHLGAEVRWTPPTGVGPITSYVVTAEPGAITKTVAASETSVRFSRLPEDGYTFTVRGANSGGNGPPSAPSNRVVSYIDDQPPSVAITYLPEYSRNNQDVRFQASDDGLMDKVECALDGQAFATCSNPWQIWQPADGRHQVSVRATDTAGNEATATGTFTEDHSSPTLQVTSQPSKISRDQTAHFAYTASDAITKVQALVCYLDGQRRDDFCSPETAEFEGLTDGLHHFAVVAYDYVGNGTAYNYEWQVDSTNPAIEIKARPAAITADTTAEVTFNVTDQSASTIQCRVDAQSFSDCANSVLVRNLALGQHSITVRAVDAAGNTAERAITWTVAAVPGVATSVHAVRSDRSAAITWVQAAGNGSPVTGYTITSSPGGITKTVAGDATSATIGGLTNGTGYTFTVTATNAVGDSAASGAVATASPRPASPTAPTSVTAVRGDKSATRVLDQAVGQRVPGHRLHDHQLPRAGSPRPSPAPTPPPPPSTGLTNGTGYTFTVKATNAVGDSAASGPSQQRHPGRRPRHGGHAHRDPRGQVGDGVLDQALGQRVPGHRLHDHQLPGRDHQDRHRRRHHHRHHDRADQRHRATPSPSRPPTPSATPRPRPPRTRSPRPASRTSPRPPTAVRGDKSADGVLDQAFGQRLPGHRLHDHQHPRRGHQDRHRRRHHHRHHRRADQRHRLHASPSTPPTPSATPPASAAVEHGHPGRRPRHRGHAHRGPRRQVRHGVLDQALGQRLPGHRLHDHQHPRRGHQDRHRRRHHHRHRDRPEQRHRLHASPSRPPTPSATPQPAARRNSVTPAGVPDAPSGVYRGPRRQAGDRVLGQALGQRVPGHRVHHHQHPRRGHQDRHRRRHHHRHRRPG